MRILIVGNGFDRAHNLPTQYKDFLNFMSEVVYDNDHNCYVRVDEETRCRIKKLGYNNLWLEYFRNSFNKESKWCDFEWEIKYAINQLIKFERSLKDKLDYERELVLMNSGIVIPPNSFVYRVVQSLIYSYNANNQEDLGVYLNEGSIRVYGKEIPIIISNTDYDDYTIGVYEIGKKGSIKISFKQLKKYIITQLMDFTKCFELYLCKGVNKLSRPNNSALSNIIYDFLGDKTVGKKYYISFNYTDTLERYFPKFFKENNGCYIHGKAVGDEKNNLVLGIDECDNENDPALMGFKKYFQRSVYNCSHDYEKWIDTANAMGNSNGNSGKENYTCIIGHSLTLADRDILKKVIMAKNMYTIIYYHEDNGYVELYENLAVILGAVDFERMKAKGRIELKQLPKEQDGV